jgi:hypothetical protein
VDAVVVFTERDRLAFEQDAHRTTFAVIPPASGRGGTCRGIRASRRTSGSTGRCVGSAAETVDLELVATGAAGAFAEIEFVLAVKPDRALHRRLGGSYGKVIFGPEGRAQKGEPLRRLVAGVRIASATAGLSVICGRRRMPG